MRLMDVVKGLRGGGGGVWLLPAHSSFSRTYVPLFFLS